VPFLHERFENDEKIQVHPCQIDSVHRHRAYISLNRPWVKRHVR
jgi:hypothetical protein